MKTRTDIQDEFGRLGHLQRETRTGPARYLVYFIMALALIFVGCEEFQSSDEMASVADQIGETQGDSEAAGGGESAISESQEDDAEFEPDRPFEEDRSEVAPSEEAPPEDEQPDEEIPEQDQPEEERPEEDPPEANDPSDAGDANVNMPQVCAQSAVPPAGCECANEAGFTTYTFEHAGQQRCMTSYVDPQARNEPLPLIIQPNCYTSNALEHPDVDMARLYKYHYLDLTSPDGGWSFPLNNEVNDGNYQRQCEDASTKDIGYLKGVFKVVDQMIADGLVDPNKVFVNGFSQNSVFAIFMGTCFPNRIAGVWQGASGIYSQDDESRALPKCEGACTASAFIEHGYDCRDVEPCETCQYFPVFPERTGRSIKACIAMYDNDGAAHSTAVPAYRLLREQGHDPKLMIFGSDPQIRLGDHDGPLNPMAWIASCLGLHEPCSQRCSDTVLTCMDTFKREFRDEQGRSFTMDNPDHRDFASRHYNGCLLENTNVCRRGCSGSREMLTILETPACECDVDTVSCDCQTSNVQGACE